MKTTKPKHTTIEDLEHKIRAQLVQLYEAACGIEYPCGPDLAFRDALHARIRQGVTDLARERAGDEARLITIAQDVRLYKASAGIRKLTVQALAFRIDLQKRLGSFYALKKAVKDSEAVQAGGGAS
jgi:hypothetical protein